MTIKKNNIVNPELSSKLQIITKISNEQKKKLINWFAKQNIEYQMLIFAEQKNQFFKLKNDEIDKNLLSLASYLLAINHFYDKDRLLRTKNKSQTLNELGNSARIGNIKLKKERYNPKKQKLLSYYGKIKELYDDDFSSRDIKDYLLKKYKFDVSHTLIINFINTYIKGKK